MRSLVQQLRQGLRWDVSPGDEMITVVGRLLLMGVFGGGLVGGVFGASIVGSQEWAFAAFCLGAMVGMFFGAASQGINAVLLSLAVRFGRRLSPVAVAAFPIMSAVAVGVAFIGSANVFQLRPMISLLGIAMISVLIAVRTVSWCLRPIEGRTPRRRQA